MSFDPDWLALREPADHAARNADVFAACAAHLSNRDHVAVVDLGCGTGSNLRALAPSLPDRQSWRLVDHDPNLLHCARKTLCDWSDAFSETATGGLRVMHEDKTIDVAFQTIDLASDLNGALAGDIDLVTAAALFDLVSKDWMEAFVDRLAQSRTPLYAVLTYNGVETWKPSHGGDARVLAAFHAHQMRDKGLGPACGPHAAATLAGLLSESGFVVRQGASDWVLSAGANNALIAALADGIAGACRDTRLLDAALIDDWRRARQAASVRIGHVDLFAHVIE